jgi:tRNA (mo5U34)-methyltransferase
MPATAEARAFLEALEKQVVFYQKFELVPGVWTPGGVDTGRMLDLVKVPQDLTGKSVLDVGCFNGAVGFLCERRGASRVVVMDVQPDASHFGVAQIKEFLGSKIEYVQGNIYDLTYKELTGFDYVTCFGVLYHLRHLLLGIDMLYGAAKEACFVEMEFGDRYLPEGMGGNWIFFDRPHLINPEDPTNWFAPTLEAYANILESSGFTAELCATWPEDDPHRCAFKCIPKPRPEWIETSYEGGLYAPPLYETERFRDMTAFWDMRED